MAIRDNPSYTNGERKKKQEGVEPYEVTRWKHRGKKRKHRRKKAINGFDMFT